MVRNEAKNIPLPRIAALFPDIFYGWVITGALALVMFSTVGVGFYSMGVFLDGLPTEKGFSPLDVSAPTSLYFVLNGLFGPLVGRLVDRWGPRGPLMSGTILMSCSLVLLGHVELIWHLWFVYVLMAIGFSLSSTVTTNAIMVRWFTNSRGKALAISHSGISVGGILITPLATHLLHQHGIEFTSLVLALLVIGVALPVTYIAVSADPRMHGLLPDGNPVSGGWNGLLSEAYQSKSWEPKDVVRTQTFWIVATAFSLVLFAQHCLLLHEVSLIHERSGSAQIGAFAVTLTAFASAISRLIVGSFVDRFDKRRLAAAVMITQAVSLLLFSQVASTAQIYACALLFGFTIGNVFMLQSLLIGEFFGFASFGTVFGMLIFITQIAGGMGPWGLTKLNQILGGYGPSLQLLAGLVVAGAVIILTAKVPLRTER